MKCPSCTADVSAGSNFCSACGAALRVPCGACGHANAAGSRFCASCGVFLAGSTPASLERAPRSAGLAERRHMTVMFADLVGSVTLPAKLDEEDLLRLMAAYYDLVHDAVSPLGGFIAKHMGDGVLVYFGYPSAHEDDAERAVRAGLAIAANVGRLGPRAALQVRVGIATGPVIIDAVGGSAERTIYGEAPNVAARLQSLAEPNSVVVDQFTWRLIEPKFDCRDLGRKDVRGLGPTAVWQVERMRSYESRIAARAAQTPLIGRREELDLMLRRWEQAKAGEGCAVLVSGEPGIGKSRIAEVVIAALADEPHVGQKYYGSAIHQASAFFPIVAQLEHAAGFKPEDLPEAQVGKLERFLAPCSADPARDVALIAELLSLDGGSRYPRLALQPRKRMEETFSALLGQIAGAVATRPGVILFEDAHWLDPCSHELLERLIERIPSLPILLIVTARSEFQPTWLGQPQVTFLPLKRLGPRERVSLIGELTSGRRLPEEVLRHIAEHTDGVPLFLEELTKMVLESGALQEDADSYTLSEMAPALAIPTTLQASLLARLDRLNVVREIAQEAAAIGREFAYELFAAVTSRDEAALISGLEQLAAAGLLLQRGVPPRASYTFKHALIQDVAYGSLLRSRREALHARIAAVYEQQFPEVIETRPELLAHHLEQAGLFERAIEGWCSAAQMTAERGAVAATAAQLRRGLDLVGHVADEHRRRVLELKLQTSLGGALMGIKGYTAPETTAAFRRARALCLELGDMDQLLRVIWGQFTSQFAGGCIPQALSEAQELLRLSERLGDAAGRRIGHAGVGASLLHLGRLPEARGHLEEAIRIHLPNAREAALLYGQCGEVTALSYLGLALLLLGFPEDARRTGRQAIETARGLSHPTSLCFAHSVVSRVSFLQRDAEGIAEGAQEVAALAAKHGLKLWGALGDIYCGWNKLETGTEAEAIASIREGIARYRAVGAGLSLPLYLATLAEAERRAGKPSASLDLLREAGAAVAAGGECWITPELHRQKGEALLAIGEEARAWRELRTALARAREGGAAFWELRAAKSLAPLRGRHGERPPGEEASDASSTRRHKA